MSTTDGLHNRKWSYDPFKSRWRSFMSLDYNLNVLKDDVKIGSETFLENSKAMEKLLLDLQQKVEKVRYGHHIIGMDLQFYLFLKSYS